ncbi:MAG: hypothetical protein KAW14_05830 [Candidatus Aegiribacteria sp.]|nr:hypothetical protein [Candidatus Aegiribacteria sp.]
MVITVVVLDACILISLAQVNRFNVLSNLTDFNFVTTEHVLREITDEQQLKEVLGQVEARTLEVIRLVDPATMHLYFQLKDRIGSGEASCIAIASKNNWMVCSDDQRKVPGIAGNLLSLGALIRFDDLLRIAQAQGIISNIEISEIQAELIKISRMRLSDRNTEEP